MLQISAPQNIDIHDHLPYGTQMLTEVVNNLEHYMKHFSKNTHPEDLQVLKEVITNAQFLKGVFEKIGRDHNIAMEGFPEHFDFRGHVFTILTHHNHMLGGGPASISIAHAIGMNITLKDAVAYYYSADQQSNHGWLGRLMTGRSRRH